ncbi:DHH family phosphoesterase [Clostridium sp. MSJ-4]|uniref:DHH family phosphoesterase n=1 Tax=Clostridium simiarum TaxID=2841506 RepID=A0ABS6EXM9_9CLOT|nr:DHH family phosphoesterase [Clostridium simiarum]MBU5590972.1 DHH family phosphoesterase [Clostridium simiarum]
MHKNGGSIYSSKQWYEYDPFMLNNMKLTIDRLVKAINEREKIVIYGSSDVDSIFGVSLLLLVLKYLNADVEYYISENINENCKLDSEVIKNHIKFLGADVLISIGCSIESLEQEVLCKNIGMDIIVTDNKSEDNLIHSLVINPNLKGSNYKEKELSNSGVVFKLCQAIASYYNMKSINKYIDLVMLGTLASGKALKGENSIIYEGGLSYLPHTNNYGLRALMKYHNIHEFNYKNLKNIVFLLTPTLNAIGRMDNARIVVELLTTNDAYRAAQIAKYLSKEVNNNILNT